MVKELKVKKSSLELAYRTEHYHGIKIIADRPITCTACGNKVIAEIGKIFTNPVIGTLLCEKCWDHFNNTTFSFDEDNLDKYCRLCAHENNLFYCGSSNCKFAFCKRCIRRNAPFCLLDIEKKNWKCFICEPKPVWELRAVCDSIMDCLAKRSKTNSMQNELKKRDSRLPYQKYQSLQVKKMQKALRSICDNEEEDDDNFVKNKPVYSKSIKKEESYVTTKESNKSKRHTLNQLCSTSSSSNSSDNEIMKKESSKQDKDVTISSPYSSNFDSKENESISRVKHRRSASKRDKINVNKISNKDETIDSNSESSEENTDDSKNQNKKLLNRSNRKKCSMKQSTNKEILISQSPIDTDSSSGKEFQRTKLVRSNVDSLHKINKNVHKILYKKNIINKQQGKYFKSNIAEILDELKQQCSVFELQAQHIEKKFKRKPMYMEDADKIIYKSKSAINKVITEFSNYKEHLIDFYKTFVSSVKEEEEHESSEDDTTLMSKKPHKRKSSDTIDKDNSQSIKDKKNIISDCDSEIFSENESIKHEVPAVEIKTNICDNKSPGSEELRVSDNASPILGGNQHNRKTLVKLSNNEVIKDNINSNQCIKNDDNNLTKNSNVTKCEIPETKSKNISNKLLTAIPSNVVVSNLTNDSLNDIFDGSLELNNELNESNTAIVNVQENKDIQDLNTDEGRKESNENSNTLKCNEPKENVPLSDKKELHLLEKEEQNKKSIFRKKTPDIFESNKSDSNSDETVFNEYPTETFHIDKPNEKISETLAKQDSNQCDSDISNISDIPFNSEKVSDKSKDPIYSIDQNKSNITEEKTDTNNESDSSTVVLSNLNTTVELTSDNVEQHNNENCIKERCFSEETNILDRENDVTNEENIKNALLESDSDDSVSSSGNKEMEINIESNSKDLNKIQLTTFDNESTKSDDLLKLQIQMNNNKSEKKELGKKRNYDLESDSSVGSRVKRRRLQLNKNYYYMNDKKLRMICHVQLKLLTDDVLNQYKDALEESKEYQNNKKINRLINLDTLEKSYKRSSVTSKEDNLSKSLQSLKTKQSSIKKEEDSLLEHLKKVQDGSASIDMQDNSDNNEQNLNSPIENHSAPLTNDDLMLEADKIAKDLLLNSSDSNMDDSKEQEQSNVSDKDEKSLKEKNESIEKNEIKKEEPSEENNERSSTKKKEKKLKKRSKWRRNKILTMKISDSESEKEQEKWDKSQEKQKEKEEDDDKDNVNVKKTTEHKRKKARRIFDSDSDVKEISDSLSNSSSSSSSSSSEVMILSDSDDSGGEKKKKKKKQNSKKSSDTESSTTGNKPKPKRRRIKNVSTDSNSDSDKMNNSQGTSSKTGRKNIRKVLKDKQVADDTKQAAKEEEERLKRIMERQKLYNEMYEIRLAGEEKVDKLVLDFDPDTKKELISVNKDLVKRLKPHQAEGIKFMWDACFESLERIKTTSGSGCIIAHCMGLGKTLQVISLSHTLLTHEETGIKTILVVCPLSTVLNWVNEFEMWLKDVENGDIDTFELTKCKKNFERKYQLQSWHQSGGVLIIGYEMFRNLTGSNKNIRKNMKDAILKCLVDPGPDLIVCDEGHLLKNEDTALSKSMKRVKTLRRIVLTGTPLQNNLIEYHCMVQFVKPNLLGTKREFLNRFVNPITNGQFDNSTEYDVKLMKKRAHVLHKLLKGSIQRFDYSVLTPFLPPKQEYVIFVRLTDVQIKLYQYYLDNLTRHFSGMKGTLFADFQALQRIWTHPIVLRLNSEKIEKVNEKKRYTSDSEGSLKNFIVSGDDEETTSSNSSDSDIQSIHSSSPIRKRRTRNNEIDSEPELVEVLPEKEEEWWSQFVQPEHFEDMRISTKLVLLFGILKECEKIGDKVLVFSQSLYSLTLIEQFLAQIDEAEQNNKILERLEGHTGSWSLGLDYFRLDGQTSAENRNIWCKIFNKPSNTRARLFLISTRAGGLGINLTAANRVIIFDASWNPSHDIQSIFRVYRFGQKKPCYVYRFLASGTMEEKIYNRQVTKLSLSCRVVDEQQIERHYSHNALNELYKFEPHTNINTQTLNLPKDRLLAEIFLKYKNLVENYHEHDSLLENKADEELDEEERKQAWLEYEEEKERPNINATTAAYQNNILLQQYNNMIANLNRQNMAINNTMQFSDYENLQKLIEKDYPNATPEQRKFMTTKALVDMYNYWEQQATVQPNRNSLLAQNMQKNIQQKTTTLGTTNISAAMNQNLLRQHLLQNQQIVYNSNNTYTNVSNPQLKGGIRVINQYVYPKPSTSNVQPRNEITQITIEPAKATETSAKTSTIPTNKEQEE